MTLKLPLALHESDHLVLETLSGEPCLGTPTGGGVLHIPSDNARIISKAQLAIAAMFGELKKENQT